MTRTPGPSQSGAALVMFYDGSVMSVAEIIDECVTILCLGGDSECLYEVGEQLELWP